ncbi:MAG: hypothetical protein ACFFD2_19940 [Promethearchaeota archaeon]
MNFFVICLDAGFIAGIIAFCSYLLFWLTKEKVSDLQFEDAASIIFIWIIILIIIKNILYFSYVAINPPEFSPLRPFFSLIFLIVDSSITFPIIYIGCKLEFWDTMIFGVILLVARRILELACFYLMIFILNNNIEGGFYIFIYI